ncbi:MAG: GNAT family N-acetyltransferase [Firmicutes bacterium]|nr:GNAT family N-acetyltransferase [Bacillota bacterium]
MGLYLDKMTEDMAKRICKWKYPGVYKTYNMPSWKNCVDKNFGITNHKIREKEFLVLKDNNNNLCGYIRLKEDSDNVLIGVGLKPSKCGQGIGNKLMKLVLEECNNRYGNKNIRLLVRSFNKRAIRCYEKVGFKIVKTVRKNTLMGEDKFTIMEYQLKIR